MFELAYFNFFIFQPFSSGQWPCDDFSNYNISASYLCDGTNDCPNGEDEDPKVCKVEGSIKVNGLVVTIAYFIVGRVVFFICKF